MWATTKEPDDTVLEPGTLVRVLEVHSSDNSPGVKAGDVVTLAARATVYDGDFLYIFTEDAEHRMRLTYARVEVEGGIERVQGLLVSDGTRVPLEAPVPDGRERDAAGVIPGVKNRFGPLESDDPAPDPAVAAVDLAADVVERATIPAPPFLSTDSATRKLMPVASGVLKYFPDAVMCVSWISRNGNDKHNPGQPLHWDKTKSADEPDAEVRHMLDHFRGLPPDPGLEPLAHLGHLASKAWRALADLQRACDAAGDAYALGEDWRR